MPEKVTVARVLNNVNEELLARLLRDILFKNDILFRDNTSVRGQITKILMSRTISSLKIHPNSLQNFSVKPGGSP